jgi:hypothetical protein
VCVIALCGPVVALSQGIPADPRAFHDTVTTLLRRAVSRPMMPGDTFVTWSPRPGGMFHSTSAQATYVRTSLLRGDDMLGTASTNWRGGITNEFAVEWTRRDAPLPGLDTATRVTGTRIASSCSVSVRVGMES